MITYMTYIKRMLVIILCGLSAAVNMSGQDNIDYIPETLDMDFFKRGISPQVALMNRYGDYPVDLQNGLVDITIPLYTLEGRYFNLPLGLKFHASGLRSDEPDGLLGTRWALSGGGHVSRIVKGYADDYRPFNPEVMVPGYMPGFHTLFGTAGSNTQSGPKNNHRFLLGWYYDRYTYYPAGSYRDTEYDIFSYSLPSGKSGKFILKDDGTGKRTAFLMPYEPITVTMFTGRSGSFEGVCIVDEDGTTYFFGGDNNYFDTYHDIQEECSYITTWHLRSVESANNKEAVYFDYEKVFRATYARDKSWIFTSNLHGQNESSPYSFLLEDTLQPPSIGTLEGNWVLDDYLKKNDNSINLSNYPLFPSSIRMEENGKTVATVDFTYSTNQYGRSQGHLREMSVKDGKGNIVKKIAFRIQETAINQLQFLDAVEFINPSDTTQKEIYSFEYYSEISNGFPSRDYMASNSDRWGYYSQGAGWLKREYGFKFKWLYDYTETIRSIDIQGGDKKSRGGSMRCGMVRRIHYPTGGTTEFQYEANSYFRYNRMEDCGGLRIKKIINTSGNGKTEVKHYGYANGVMPAYFWMNESENIIAKTEVEYYIIDDHPEDPNKNGNGHYLQMVMQSTFPSRYTDIHSNIVYYPEVTEQLIDDSQRDTLTTIYSYNVKPLDVSRYRSTASDEFTGCRDESHFYYHVSPEYFWRGNHLRSKTVYNASGKKVKEYAYEYRSFYKGEAYDLPVIRFRYHASKLNSINGEKDPDKQELIMVVKSPQSLAETFAFVNQKYTSGAEKLVKETETSYMPDGKKLTQVREISYEPQYLLPDGEKISGSDGKVKKSSLRYPHHFPNQDPYREMVGINILNPVIEQADSLDGRLQQRTMTLYKEWGEFEPWYVGFAPESIYRRSGNDPDPDPDYGLRIWYQQYDTYGNPVYVTKDFGQRMVCLWSYNYRYPIVEVKGATVGEVKAALGYNDDQLEDLFASTNPNTDWIFDQLWNAFSLKPVEYTVYTYKPLVGVIKSRDSRNVQTDYEYDGFGRLQKVTRAGKVINNYQYNYKN